MSYLSLFITFFTIGLFTIGGGLASLPLLYEAVVDSGMISRNLFVDMLAISQSTPGPIGINMSTFAGYQISGIPGGFVATLGMVTPSLIIIVLIAAWFTSFSSHPLVQDVMGGIRPAALGLIASAAWFIFREALFVPGGELRVSLPALGLFIVLGTAYKLKPATPAIYILAGGILGIFIF
ncbi:chromate transporter [Marispirochaeta sp.]|jgi:chromate transporter|uniref:chromate transporter n=1 Tax=Marispirochaeta sp. TaxID=2038653 RepID=UPI0029C878E7|nr:chromate transporter [Marispirochaeta sp.]